jgi:hypothetical protein
MSKNTILERDRPMQSQGLAGTSYAKAQYAQPKMNVLILYMCGVQISYM